MTYGYFPGCSLHSTAKEYDISLRAICKVLDIELKEIDDWNCCGATPAHTSNEELGIALPYSNLVNASNEGLKDIVAPCASCYNRLKHAQHAVNSSAHIRERMNELAGELDSDISILNMPEFIINKIGLDILKAKLLVPLSGITVASYYGCLLVRPSAITHFDDVEDPMSMDTIVETLGGSSAKWSRKTECCGGSLAIPETDIVLELGKTIFNSATLSEADCIVVACPLCQANLDMRQKQINKKYNTNFELPVLYITQLVGLALGISPSKLGLNLLFTSPEKFLDKINMNNEKTAVSENKPETIGV